MSLSEVKGSGVDQALLKQLSGWGIKYLTDIQRMSLEAGIADGCSMIVSAPTSSGKTLVGEIALLNALRRSKKALYLVSHKALADQKYNDFRRKFGEDANSPIASVGLSTGDREEGEHRPRLLIATYEKALGLVLSGEVDPKSMVIVADELQILADPKRGADIETLCALLQYRSIEQFVALTATVENPKDLAEWLSCKLVTSKKRDINLFQEIWYDEKKFTLRFGDEEGIEKTSKSLPDDAVNAASLLVKEGYGPVLVFTETRREATEYANEYSQRCVRVSDGIALAEQLDLFSEPTESSSQLRNNAEKKVAFHTADLTSQERQVIEQGFIESKFEVCFATSTLAAGVNFPFKSVLFPSLTYKYGERMGTPIPKGEYRNMSGRAGRLGLHDEGFAILLPKDRVELSYANQLILPINESVISQLVNLSMRRTILILISSGIIDCKESVRYFFEQTFYWHQIKKSTPAKLDKVLKTADDAIHWLINTNMIEECDTKQLRVTPLGKATATSGLLPSTAASFVKLIEKHISDLENHFDEFILAILHWVCNSEELSSDQPSRFLPYPSTKAWTSSMDFLSKKRLFLPLDRNDLQLAKCVHALFLYIEGVEDGGITYQTKIPSGGLHRLALDVKWVLEGLQRITCVPELRCSQKLTNNIAMLSRRVRWGAPSEALDMIRVAERHGVPGFGRQRAMALLKQGIATFDDILSSTKEKIEKILGHKLRMTALFSAVSNVIGWESNSFQKTHVRVGKELGFEELVESCYLKLGTEYEQVIIELLRKNCDWKIKNLDDGIRQNVPDILIELDGLAILLECKTCSKSPPLIKKEEASAVIQKSLDFDPKMRRVTLGKPHFEENCKTKTLAAHELTLIEHSVFIEGLLRVHKGSVTSLEFLQWLGTPGIAEIERLQGKPSYLS